LPDQHGVQPGFFGRFSDTANLIRPSIMQSIQGDHDGLRVAADVKLGDGVKLFGFVNLYGCEIGDQTRIGCFVEIQSGAKVGARCKISSHTFICEGVMIEDEVFIGHGVMFINDRWPRATHGDGKVIAKGDWQCQATLVKKGASIGSGATILGGLTIGENAMIGAGSVVTGDVPAGATVAGNPACPIQSLRRERAPTAEDPQATSPRGGV
jgi:UDP-2-acetamido-3-amino-2,3-dideoxy-glucuronate N-acetyltransferase